MIDKHILLNLTVNKKHILLNLTVNKMCICWHKLKSYRRIKYLLLSVDYNTCDGCYPCSHQVLLIRDGYLQSKYISGYEIFTYYKQNSVSVPEHFKIYENY